MTFENTAAIESAILESVGTARRDDVPAKRVAKPKPHALAGTLVNASQFNNDLAQAFAVAGNAAAMMRHYLNNLSQWQHIVDAWTDLHDAADDADAEQVEIYKKAIASFRTTLRSASLELFEDALTITDGKIVKAKSRNKAKKAEDALVEFVKANAGNMTDAQKASAIEAIKALLS